MQVPSLIVGASLLMLLIGCQPRQPKAQPVSRDEPVVTSGDQFIQPDQAVLDDPCAARMHDVSGAILAYYTINQRLPIQLAEVKPYVPTGANLLLACPATNQPYVYSPVGLRTTDGDRTMIVFDPIPSHRGGRYCILLRDMQPGGVPQLDVVLLPEGIFRLYQSQ